jgi:hypothetical protein
MGMATQQICSSVVFTWYDNMRWADSVIGVAEWHVECLAKTAQWVQIIAYRLMHQNACLCEWESSTGLCG